MKELSFRVFAGDKPIGAFPTLYVADAYARSQIESMLAHTAPRLRETGYHVGRYAESERIAAPMIRYLLGPDGIERYGYTGGSPAIDQVQFEKICTQIAAVTAMFAGEPLPSEPLVGIRLIRCECPTGECNRPYHGRPNPGRYCAHDYPPGE